MKGNLGFKECCLCAAFFFVCRCGFSRTCGIRLGRIALRCTRSSIWFASKQPISYVYLFWHRIVSVFFFFIVFEMSVLGWSDEIQCTSCADACELQGFRLSRRGGRDDDKEPANVPCVFRPCTTNMHCNLGR